MGEPIQVGERLIGPGEPCFVIAEAGVNHNGDVELAKRLVDAARDAGADAVKFQTWVTEKLVVRDAPRAAYQTRNLGGGESQFEMLKPLELSHDEFRELKEHADSAGILFFSTPDEEDSADFLEALGVPLFKVSSAEVSNLPFVRHVASKGRPLILSTGMSTLGEVEAAVRAVEQEGNRQLVLLHCVSAYPADPSTANLRVLETLAGAFGHPVGFSDHTLGIHVAVAAVARGACVVEKHLTLDRSLAGPDHAASAEPGELGELVAAIRLVEGALGDGVKRITPAEADSRLAMQKAVVARRPIRAGAEITEADVTLLRAEGGLPPSFLPIVIGRRAARDLEPGATVTLELLS